MKSNHKEKTVFWVVAPLVLILLGALAYITLPGRGQLPELPEPAYWPTDGWQAMTPEQQGIHSSRLAQEIQDIQDQDMEVDSLMIIRNGYVILDVYFAPYDGSFAHDLGSVTKSVTAALVGIAADRGLLQLDQPVISFFSDRSIANLDERKERITIADLISMRSGMESGCLDGDESTLDAMRASPDWVQAVLNRKMVHEPGTHFCYDSPGIHLLSAILQKVTGMTAHEYAQQYLFGPLGIQDVVWLADPQGYTQGWGDLHLKPRDAAKLGYLWLHRGVWDRQQIVPAAWISASVTAHSRMVGSEYGYGYGWWVSPVDFYALGRGGQFIRVIPSKNMVIVITGGGFNIDEMKSFLLGLLINTHEQLSADPVSQAKLIEALSTAAQGTTQHLSKPLPGIALEISGQTFTCSDNPAQVTSLRLEFTDPTVTGFDKVQYGQNVFWPIGMDGKYRVAADGQAQAGYWEDTDTFVIEIFDIGQLTRTLNFAGNHLQVIIPEIEMSLECETQ